MMAGRFYTRNRCIRHSGCSGCVTRRRRSADKLLPQATHPSHRRSGRNKVADYDPTSAVKLGWRSHQRIQKTFDDWPESLPGGIHIISRFPQGHRNEAAVAYVGHNSAFITAAARMYLLKLLKLATIHE
jgi:hypothetical protein